MIILALGGWTQTASGYKVASFQSKAFNKDKNLQLTATVSINSTRFFLLHIVLGNIMWPLFVLLLIAKIS